MKSKNSILLLLNQNNTLSYATLLSKISGNYSTANSARAALSRTLRTLLAKGLIVKNKDLYTISTKGKRETVSDMHTQLLMKLNESIIERDTVKNLPNIVKQISMLIEWGKLDDNLVKVSKGSTRLDIGKLKKLHKEFRKKIRQDLYLSDILSSQIDQLENWDFPDSLTMYFEKKAFREIKMFLTKLKSAHIMFQPRNDSFNPHEFQKIEIEKKKDLYEIPRAKLVSFLNQLKKKKLESGSRMYFHGIEILIIENNLYISGNYKKIRELRKIINKGKLNRNTESEKIKLIGK